MRNTNGNAFISYANSSLTKGEGEYIYFLSFFFFETMNGTVEYLLAVISIDDTGGR